MFLENLFEDYKTKGLTFENCRSWFDWIWIYKTNLTKVSKKIAKEKKPEQKKRTELCSLNLLGRAHLLSSRAWEAAAQPHPLFPQSLTYGPHHDAGDDVIIPNLQPKKISPKP